jgi:16S rRNA pseudouridine516 synthase
MLEAISNKVIYLKRISIGKLTLPNDLELGAIKEITINDIFE